MNIYGTMHITMNFAVTNDWKAMLRLTINTPEYQKLVTYVAGEYKNNRVYPSAEDIFTALILTSFSEVKVVILGQDPYHNEGQAHGLAFSVNKGIVLPPSLKNIYKEIESDLGISKNMNNGDLTPWAQQGVLLLNTVLTVEAHTPGSHKNKGWEMLTDAVIKKVSEEKEHVVFILWGAQAQKKEILIDSSRHLILTAAHPSPLSSYRGFFGSKPFSATNKYLQRYGKEPIQW